MITEERYKKEVKLCKDNGHEVCCKWCCNCVIEPNGVDGHCYDDIGEFVEVEMDYCPHFVYDADLNRC